MLKLEESADLDHSVPRNARPLKVVLGISLGNHPKIYNPDCEFYIRDVAAIMVSYAEVERRGARREIERRGLHSYLNFQGEVYLDNGAFSAIRNGVVLDSDRYCSFAAGVGADWFPIPRDFIPLPGDLPRRQRLAASRTIEMNDRFAPLGFVPVIHGGDYLGQYVQWLKAHLKDAPRLALGGLVPRLLNSKGMRLGRRELLEMVAGVRSMFIGNLHVFGVGGITTMHLMSALGIDSIDTMGWRIRAAWGLVQLPGNNERQIVERGSWRGKPPDAEELRALRSCCCPACDRHGFAGLKSDGAHGFRCRATHNAWTLVQEAREIQRRMQNGDYRQWVKEHIASPIFRDLIAYALDLQATTSASRS